MSELNDLIKRGAVCDMLHEEMGAWGSCADEIEALLKANDALWEIPAVDAVEVVRCKDCIHHQIMENKKSFMYWHNCKLWCADIAEDDFCSYGERREDG